MKDNNWEKLLVTSIKEQNIESIRNIIKQNKDENFGFTDSKGRGILHFAVEYKNEKTLPILQELLKLELDLNAIDEKFESAIELAQRLNNVPAAAILKHRLNIINRETQK